jgi:geranylgeranyl diphosphate synthase, type I
MSSRPAATEAASRSGAAETEEFDRLLDAFRGRIDREIAAFLAAKREAAAGDHLAGAAAAQRRAGSPDLSDPTDLVDGIASLLAQGGKRLRPALVYFTYRACGGRAEEQVLPLALSTELLHTYLLIHDDIMDHAETRRGQPAAHVRFAALHGAGGLRGDGGDFGRSAALLLGDLAHTFAVELFMAAVLAAHPQSDLRDRSEPGQGRSAADLPPTPQTPQTPQTQAGMKPPAALDEITRCFSEMSEEVIGGQYLEFLLAHYATEAVADSSALGPPLAATFSSRREAELMRILRLKSGRYTAERPIQLGALLAGAPAAARAELSRYGTAVGEAFQLQDDLLGVFGDPATTGKPVGDDLREGKYTLLIHHALLALAPVTEDRRFLLGALGNAALSAAEVTRAQEILESTGARRAVAAMITARLAEARDALEALTTLDGFNALNALHTPHAAGAGVPSRRTPESAAAILFLAGLLDYLRERNQ